MSEVDHFDNVESDFSADDQPFESQRNRQQQPLQSLISGEEELEPLDTSLRKRPQEHSEESDDYKRAQYERKNGLQPSAPSEGEEEIGSEYYQEEVSEYEYVIEGGLENEDQEIYLDVNFPEYMLFQRCQIHLLKDPVIGCYINKARKCGSLSRKFGKWDRRYLHFSLEDLELLYSNQPDDKVQNSIPLEKVLRVRQDTGFSKKGKCIILYCTTRVFFFQFYDMLNFNKFLLFMGYIRHKRDHLPFYIHAVSKVFKGKHGDLDDRNVVLEDQAQFDKIDSENLFLTIAHNNLCYRTKEEILQILENKKHKGAIKKETRIVSKNTQEEIKAAATPLLKSTHGELKREESVLSADEEELRKIRRQQKEYNLRQKKEYFMRLDEEHYQKLLQSQRHKKKEPKQEPGERVESEEDIYSEEKRKELAMRKEQEKKDQEIQALRRQIMEMKKKEEEKFIREQNRRKRRQLQQRPDVSESEEEDNRDSRDEEETNRQRYRRRSADKQREAGPAYRNKTVQHRKKKPRKKSLVVNGIDEINISDLEEGGPDEVEIINDDKPSRRSSIYRAEGQNGPRILNPRGHQRRSSRKIRRNSQISNYESQMHPGMNLDTLINEKKKKKKLVLKKMSDFKRRPSHNLDNNIEMADNEMPQRKKSQYQGNYLEKLKKQNQNYQTQIDGGMKKKKRRKRKHQQIPMDDQIELIDKDSYNKKAALMVVQRQRQEQLERQQSQELTGATRNPIRPGQHLGGSMRVSYGEDKFMKNYMTNKLKRKKPIRPSLNFSSVIPNKKQPSNPQSTNPIGYSGIQLGVGNRSSNFWENQIQKKNKSKMKRNANANIIEIEGLEGPGGNLAVSQTLDQNSLELKKKKRKRRRKNKTKNKDNIFASKQSLPQHHFPDLGDPSIAQTTFNQSLAGTHGNYNPALGGTQSTSPELMFDGQGNPTLRTDIAAMDSTDRFAPAPNSGAMRAIQMHQSVSHSQFNNNPRLKDKVPRKKKRRRKKKKSNIDNLSVDGALGYGNQFSTADNITHGANFPHYLSKGNLNTNPTHIRGMNFSGNSDNSWDD